MATSKASAIAVCLLPFSLFLAGCGSSGGGSGTPPAPGNRPTSAPHVAVAATTPSAAAPHVGDRSFKVSLKPVPGAAGGAAASGSGSGRIMVEGHQSKICWSVRDVVGAPQSASIELFITPTPTYQLPLGVLSQGAGGGCTGPVDPVQLARIVAKPSVIDLRVGTTLQGVL
jgi:hypothetical protein